MAEQWIANYTNHRPKRSMSMTRLPGRSVLMCGLMLFALDVQANPPITDAQHNAMYQDCENKQHVNVLAVAGLVADFASGGVYAVLGDFAEFYAEGYKQKGCDVFLTDAQIRDRDARMNKAARDNQSSNATQAINSH
jgi:hypothetical protein